LVFSLSTVWVVPKSWCVVFPFSFTSLYFYTSSSRLSLWLMDSLEMNHLILKCLETFLFSLWYWFLVSFNCVWKAHFVWVQFFKTLIEWFRILSISVYVLWAIEKSVFQLLLRGVFSNTPSNPVCWWH
jgi:hypothetical protein